MLLFWPAVQGVGAFMLRHQTRFCDILCLDYVDTGICCHAGTAMIVNKIIKDKPLDKQVKKTCCWDSLDECVETLVLEYLPSRQRNLLNQVNHHFHQLVVSRAFSREVILESLDLESRGLQSRELWFHIIQYCMRRSQFITRLSIRNCRYESVRKHEESAITRAIHSLEPCNNLNAFVWVEVSNCIISAN